MARRRQRWKKYQSRLDPRRLVFIDETWAKTNMTRRHGRALRGRRLVAKVPHGRWRTLTFLAALRCDRIEAPCVIDGPINGLSFLAYVEQILLPTLAPGDIVIMDNLGSHKRQAIRRFIRRWNLHIRLLFMFVVAALVGGFLIIGAMRQIQKHLMSKYEYTFEPQSNLRADPQSC